MWLISAAWFALAQSRLLLVSEIRMTEHKSLTGGFIHNSLDAHLALFPIINQSKSRMKTPNTWHQPPCPTLSRSRFFINSVKESKCLIRREIHTAHIQNLTSVTSAIQLYSPQNSHGYKNICRADGETRWMVLAQACETWPIREGGLKGTGTKIEHSDRG